MAGMHMGENWGDRLKAGRLRGRRPNRTFDIELQPPLPDGAARYAQICPGADAAGPGRAAVIRPMSRPWTTITAGLAGRNDLSVRTERTVWLARR